MASEKLFFSIEVEGADELENSLTELTQQAAQLTSKKKALNKELRELNKQFEKGEISQEEYAQASLEVSKDLASVNVELKETNKSIRANQKAYSDSAKAAKAAEGSVEKLRIELNKAQRAWDKMSKEQRENELIGGKQLKKIESLNKQVSNLEESTGRHQRGVGNYTKGLGKIGSAFKNLGGAIKGAFVGFFAFEKVIEIFSEFFESGKQLAKLTQQVQQFGEVSEEAAAKTAGNIKAIADVYEQDVNEVLIASNAAAKQFGITTDEALELISTGFAAGSNNSGEFLDIVKEYPALMQEAGLGADEFFNIINQQVKNGVYSDKGIDAIKEAGLSIREMTKPTKDALNAIGLVSEDIEKSLSDGTKTVFDVVQEVSARLGELPPQSKEVGQALADIFKGAGEDAGLDYILTLQNINTEQENLIDNLDDVGRANERLRKAQAEANETTANFFGKQNSGWTNAKAFGSEFNNKVLKVAQRLYTILIAKVTKYATAYKTLLTEGFGEFKKVMERDVVAEYDKAQVKIKEGEEEQNAQRKARAEELKKDIESLTALQLLELEKLDKAAVDSERKRRAEELRIANEAREKQKEADKKAAKEKKKADEKAIADKKKADDKAAADAEKAEEDSVKRIAKLKKEASDFEVSQKEQAEEEKLRIAREFALKELETRKLTAEQAKLEEAAINKKFDAAENALKRKRAKEQKKKDDEEKEKENDAKKAVREQVIESAKAVSQSLFDVFNARQEREKEVELSNLNARLEQGLINQQQFEKEREAIERKAFQRKKRQDIAQAIMNGAVGVTRAIATSGLVGILQAATIGVQTAAQVGVIASQKFQRGGRLVGDSHALGGIPFTVGGQPGFEAEGGESIITTDATSRFGNALSAINQAGGGVAFAKGGMAQPNYDNVKSTYQDGGTLTGGSNSNGNELEEMISDSVSRGVGNIKVINVAQETADIQNRSDYIRATNTF